MCIVQLYKTIALIVVSEFASSTIGKIISICQGTNFTLKIENELLDPGLKRDHFSEFQEYLL